MTVHFLIFYSTHTKGGRKLYLIICRIVCNKVSDNVRNKVCNCCNTCFFSSFFVSATIIVAQIFFGAGAIKQKKRRPSTVGDPSYILVINGRQYKPRGLVLGSIVYYNCVVIYVIIAVSLGFFYHRIPWSPEACQSSADCYYFNYSTIVTQYDNPTVIPIINCTLDEAYVNNVFCYDVGFHPVVGIAMLSSFINVVTPLLFAIVTRLHVFWGEKIIRESKNTPGEGSEGGYTRKCRMWVLGFGLSIFIQLVISLSLFIVLAVNYLFNFSIHENSFQFFFSNEAYIGQGIGLLCVHILFVTFYPFAHIENHRIPEEGSNVAGEPTTSSIQGEQDPSLENDPTRSLCDHGRTNPSYGTNV